MEKVPIGGVNEGIEQNPQENSYIDSNPHLKLLYKKADLSYTYQGSRTERKYDVFLDQNENKWIEINRNPRTQILVSLLSQPFFNISTVTEVPNIYGKISRFVSRVNPHIASAFDASTNFLGKDRTLFASKVMNLDRMERKTRAKMLADYMVFTSVFEGGKPDRAFGEHHNIRMSADSYSLFDFEKFDIVPIKYFQKYNELHKGHNGMKDFIFKAKRFVFGGEIEGKDEFSVVLEVIDEVIKKLIQIEDFYNSSEGVNFFSAVLKKSKYEDEFRENFYKRIKTAMKMGSKYLFDDEMGIATMLSKQELAKRSVDESFFDPYQLCHGLIAQTHQCSNVLLVELKTYRDKIFKYVDPDSIEARNYDLNISKLEELCRKFDQVNPKNA